MTSALENAFKAKLRAIAKEKNRDPADLWQSLMLERFLVRLSQSQYSRNFILKGAILLSKYIDLFTATEHVKLQAFWSDYLRHFEKVETQVLPRQVIQIVEIINTWVLKNIEREKNEA